MLLRDFRVGINKVRRARIFDSEWTAWRLMLISLWHLMTVRLIRVFYRNRSGCHRRDFQTRLVNYLGFAARSLGMVASLCGYQYYEYRNSIHGA
jgi:hypothetical protein